MRQTPHFTTEELEAIQWACSQYAKLALGSEQVKLANELINARDAVYEPTMSDEEHGHVLSALEYQLAYMVGSNQFDINGAYQPARSAWFSLMGYDLEKWREYVFGHCHPPSGVLLKPWLFPAKEIQEKWTFTTKI